MFGRLTISVLIAITYCLESNAQLFKSIPFDSIGVKLYELYTTKEGVTWMTSSAGIWGLKGRQFDGPAIGTDVVHHEIKVRNYLAEDSIRSMAQGPDSIFYFVAHDNFFLFRPNGVWGGWGWPPFIFPKTSAVSKIWIDDGHNLFAGTTKDNFYFIERGATKESYYGIEMGADKDSNYTVKKGNLTIRQIILQPGAGVFSFAQDVTDQNLVWIGTNKGMFTWNKKDGRVGLVDLASDKDITITEIYPVDSAHIWFSTLEKGMGTYNLVDKQAKFYPYPKKEVIASTKFPIKTFCKKSDSHFFVAIMDSLPAIFSTESRTYLFIRDSSLEKTRNQTTDIKVDKQGNLILLKGGRFFIADVSNDDLLKTSALKDSSLMAPFFRGIELQNGKELANINNEPEFLKKAVLKYNQNSFMVTYDVSDFADRENIHFAWRVDGYTNGWTDGFSFSVNDFNYIPFQDLKPGKYLLQLRVRVGKEDWRKQIAEMIIIITPPIWQTWWFWAAIGIGLTTIVYIIIRLREKAIRKQERIKSQHEKELLELEAKALRAQMNPHFIFNCLNSIKSLIQDDHKDKSVEYLTTFSKLIRTLFNNADKKEITLHDEIETCKLYLQLEAMRFNHKLSYSVNIDENVDLKSTYLPALIIQPFIENAIWHGIIPKETGGTVLLNVQKENGTFKIVVEDNGIGRESSLQSKSLGSLAHQSKGVNLTQSRLELDNLLQQRHAKIDIIDKTDANGKATGTKVVLIINEEQ